MTNNKKIKPSRGDDILQYYVLMPKGLLDKLKVDAKSEYRSISQQLLRIVKKYCNKL